MSLANHARPPAGARSVALLALLVAALFAVAAPAARADGVSGDVAGFTVGATDSSGASIPAQAAGDQNFTESMSFSYAASGETVQSLALALPPGLLSRLPSVSASCTQAELATYTQSGGSGCPSAAQVGTAAGTATVLGAQVSVAGQLYLMPARSSSEVAEIGVETATKIGSASFPAMVASGPITIALGPGGAPQLSVSLTLPPVASMPGLSSAGIPYVLDSLTQTLDGVSQSGKPFTWMPSSCSPATASIGMTVQTSSGTAVSGESGSGTASLTPTGCSSLPYAPKLGTTVTKDKSDPEVALTTTISQAADESATSAESLRFPSNLSPNTLKAGAEVCSKPNATYSNCTQVGTATAASPLLATPLTGALYLTDPSGSVLEPDLTIVFPPPFAMTLSGSVNLNGNSVSFATVPDLPLTQLAVTLRGGPDGLYRTSCSPARGSVSGKFTGQNGATVTASGAFTIAGCPTSSTKPRRPTVKASLTRPASATPVLRVKVSSAAGAPKVTAVTAAVPSGMRFVAAGLARRVSATGAKVKSVAVRRGQLVVTLRRPSGKATITVRRGALRISAATRRRIAARRIKSVKVRVKLTLVGHAPETFAEKVKV